MAIASKFMVIGVIVLSFVIGLLSLYLFSDLPKGQKKQHIEEVITQFINFVIYIWISKIVLNIFTFIEDPLSILAYPSDSKAFYLAMIFMVITFLYKSKRKNIKVLPYAESFIHIFLVSSFVYEFIQYVMEPHSFSLNYLILLAILIGMLFFLKEKMLMVKLMMLIVTTWSIGMIILSLTQPFVTVFNYMMTPWFIVLLFVTSIAGLSYSLRKESVTWE